MSGTPLSLILLPVLDCNAACDYCFETKSRVRLQVGDLPKFTRAILDYMHFLGADQAELYWQGGEVLLLGPAWFASADDLMHAEADASGCTFHHHMQSNMIGYGPHWDAVVRRMFNGAVGTSMDAPNAAIGWQDRGSRRSQPYFYTGALQQRWQPGHRLR